MILVDQFQLRIFYESVKLRGGTELLPNPNLVHPVLDLPSVVLLCCLHSGGLTQGKSLEVTGKYAKFCVCFQSEP